MLFARTRRFDVLLNVQLLDILVMPTLGQMFTGGFLPSGVVGLWAILAPLGALAFLEVSRAIRWFVAFVVVFLLTGILGEVLFTDADIPAWFTSAMLALNVVGAGAVSFTLLASFAHQRNVAEAAVRVEQERRATPGEHPPAVDRRSAEGQRSDDRRPLRRRLDRLRGRRRLHALLAALPPAEVVGVLDRLFTSFDTLVSGTGSRRSRRSATVTWPPPASRNPRPTTRAVPRCSRSTCAR